MYNIFFDWKWFPHNLFKLGADFLNKISQRFQVFFWKQMKFDDEKVEMSEQGVEVCLCIQVVHLLNFVKVMNVHMDKHSIHPVHSDPKLRIPFKNSWGNENLKLVQVGKVCILWAGHTIWKNLPLFYYYLFKRQSKAEYFFQMFMAFSEYMNFIFNANLQ